MGLERRGRVIAIGCGPTGFARRSPSLISMEGGSSRAVTGAVLCESIASVCVASMSNLIRKDSNGG